MAPLPRERRPASPRAVAARTALLLAALGLAYALLARPLLASHTEYVRLLDYGAGAFLGAVLLAAWLGRGRKQAPPLPSTSTATRHVRTVRPLPDPRQRALEEALEAWLERGEAPERYAEAVLACAGREPGSVTGLLREALQVPTPARRGKAAKEAHRRRLEHHRRILAGLRLPPDVPKELRP